MKFEITRENLLFALQKIIGVIERRQTLPVLSNVLFQIKEDLLTLTGTDLEIQLVAITSLEGESEGNITIPARKLFDICKLLPDESKIRFESNEGKIKLSSGRSRFTLSTLPASDFPAFDSSACETNFSVTSKKLKKIIDKTGFCMAQQDVRYYLNGLMIESDGSMLRAVSSDGHRLALHEESLETAQSEFKQIILPRKGVVELFRLLEDSEEEVEIQLSSNSIRLAIGNLFFSAKLIDGRFPDYKRVFPNEETSKAIILDKQNFKQALSRVAVLSNEKYKGVRLDISENSLKLEAHNPEHEEADEVIEIHYSEEPVVIGFNGSYMLDAINNVETENVKISFSDTNSSCLIEAIDDSETKFIVMPMRL
jgi:DNA polymerase-3 subunit beta